tara:strand:- start:30577 stop:31392 length:816 start_codon:yes stop_codon:yes gene_type:complete
LLKKQAVAFIGAGFMGQALIRGLIKSGCLVAKQITISDSNERIVSDVVSQFKVNAAKSNEKAVERASIVILAVKPQDLPSVIKSLGKKLGKEKLIISIAAGVTINTICDLLPEKARVVRAMPNIAATIGESASAICLSEAATDTDLVMAKKIFDAVGESVVVDESLMDSVTGLSGSGPAFVFVFLDALIEAGVRSGLTREMATKLASHTMYGSAKLAIETGEKPSSIKDRVSSPGGTTLAGLSVLDTGTFKREVLKAVEAARKRSKELSNK